MDMTIEELDHLCRLYMDCRLSLLEEKELEYILSRSPLTSAATDEVRALMGVQAVTARRAASPAPRPLRVWRWRAIAAVAASVAVVLAVGVHLLTTPRSGLASGDTYEYIAAYSHGRQLTGRDAIDATDSAIARADSLINYAALVSRDYISRADNIIIENTDN